jgi:hypothetical protein
MARGYSAHAIEVAKDPRANRLVPAEFGLFVVRLIEAADELFEERAHAVVARMPDRVSALEHRLRAEIDREIQHLDFIQALLSAAVT